MITAGADGVFIDIHVQPRARRSGVRGVHGHRLKIAVTEPPESGRANTATIDEIARVLKVRPGEVTLVSGTRSRQKRVFVTGVHATEVLRLVKAAIEAAD